MKIMIKGKKENYPNNMRYVTWVYDIIVMEMLLCCVYNENQCLCLR